MLPHHQRCFTTLCVFLQLLSTSVTFNEFRPGYDGGSCEIGTEVLTTTGPVLGTYITVLNQRKVNAFYNIPYAKPPVGELRFKPPEPVEPWTKTRPINKSVTYCAQFNHHMIKHTEYGILGQEDCLFLNIFTPRVFEVNAKSMPVIVYIHSGGFMYGTHGIFKPKFHLKVADTVFVTFNYRLGVFGFLTTEDEVVPGNNGLKDQVMALKWIQENIVHFGGDASRITLSGTGAGAASVHLHYLSKQSRHLFLQGISLNGCALNPWVLMEKGKEKAQRLADSLTCPTNSSEAMVECLRNTEFEKILEKIKPLFMPWLHIPVSVFGPTIERAGEDPFLSEHPYKLLEKGQVKDANWLVNFAQEEGLYACDQFSTKDHLYKELDSNWLKIAPHLFDFNFTVDPQQHDAISNNIRKLYFSTGPIAVRYRKYLLDMICDRLFVAGIIQAVRIHSRQQKTSRIYVFKLSYTGPKSMAASVNDASHYNGLSHCDDLVFGFGCYYNPFADGSSCDRIAESLAELYNEFAHNSTANFAYRYQNWPCVTNAQHNGYIPFLNFQYPYVRRLVHSDNLGQLREWMTFQIKENHIFDEKMFYSS